MIEQAITRIQTMEMYFDTLQNAYQNNPILIREDAILNQYLQLLIDYYHNGQWLKDYELDEQGKIPRNLKRGILSQDALYNFFDDIKELYQFDIDNLKWIRAPQNYSITNDKIEIVTQPHTDLWQRTYYHFRNDNAPVLQMETCEQYFSFTVKTAFDSKKRFDQCGIIMYLDSDNWLKASIEYENDVFQHLGSVVTNHGYSDWATTEIDANIKSMWYRFSRRVNDFCIECSEDGIHFKQMRICHMWEAKERIQFGIYACSPEASSFKATFTHMQLSECKWLSHIGQQPDTE